MAYLPFVDESGHDQKASPYEVLAGIAIRDTQLWNLVCAVQDAEVQLFGARISTARRELKAKELLKRKTFRLAAQLGPIAPSRRTELVAALLGDSAHPTREQLTALGQARLAFVQHVLDLCARHGAHCFASIADRQAPRPVGTGLRKDYAYLFERFYLFLNDQADTERGLIVFDEQDRSRCYVLAHQMTEYFRRTTNGRTRSSRIVPEPFFVHSDLTTGVQIADIVAYVVSWNVRVARMAEPRRPELDSFGQQVLSLRPRPWSQQAANGPGYRTWSFAVIDDLRPRDEKGLEPIL